MDFLLVGEAIFLCIVYKTFYTKYMCMLLIHVCLLNALNCIQVYCAYPVLALFRFAYESIPTTRYIITYRLNDSCCQGYTGTPYNCQGKVKKRKREK